MKKIFLSILLLPVISYSQPDLEKIIKQENPVGTDWVNEFKGTRQWNLVATIMVGPGNEMAMIDSMNKREYAYRFTADTLFSNRGFNGTVTYFPKYRSFYFNPVPSENNQMLSLYSPFRIHYLDGSYVLVERIYQDFDVYTGRILTEEEAARMFRKTPGNDSKKTVQLRHFELWRRDG